MGGPLLPWCKGPPPPPALILGLPGPLLLHGEDPVWPNVLSFGEEFSRRCPGFKAPRGLPRFPPVRALHRFGPSFSPRKSNKGEPGRVGSRDIALSLPPSISRVVILSSSLKTFSSAAKCSSLFKSSESSSRLRFEESSSLTSLSFLDSWIADKWIADSLLVELSLQGVEASVAGRFRFRSLSWNGN